MQKKTRDQVDLEWKVMVSSQVLEHWFQAGLSMRFEAKTVKENQVGRGKAVKNTYTGFFATPPSGVYVRAVCFKNSMGYHAGKTGAERSYDTHCGGHIDAFSCFADFHVGCKGDGAGVLRLSTRCGKWATAWAGCGWLSEKGRALRVEDAVQGNGHDKQYEENKSVPELQREENGLRPGPGYRGSHGWIG